MPDFLSEYILLEKTKSLKYFEENIEKLNSWAGLGQVPEQPKPIIEKTWEKPVIKGNNDFIIGFIDMEVRCKVPYLTYGDDFPRSWGIGYYEYLILFEAKTKIKSIGEVIRQIQTYRTYCRNGQYIVVSPDDRYIDILKQQHIGFVKFSCDLPKAKGQFDFFDS